MVEVIVNGGGSPYKFDNMERAISELDRCSIPWFETHRVTIMRNGVEVKYHPASASLRAYTTLS